MNSKVWVQKTATLTGHTSSVYALAASGASTFFSGSGDKIVAEWDLLHPGEGNMLARIPEIIYALYTDPENNRLLVGQATGGIHVISLSERSEIRLLQYHAAPVFHIGVSHKHGLLFSLSGDGKLGVMDINSLALMSMKTISDGKLRTLALNNDESQIAIGSADGSITILLLPDLIFEKKWQAHKAGFSVNALTFSPGGLPGSLLLSGSRDAHLNVYDALDDYQIKQSIPAHNYAIYSIAFSPDNKFMATGSRDKTIKIWDPQTFEVLHRIDNEKNEGHKNSVNKIMWHPDSGYLITAGDDRVIMVWKIS